MRILIPKAYSSFIHILARGSGITELNKITIEEIINSYMGLLKVIFSLKNFENPYFYIFLFVAICISSHISLSSADIKGAFRGLLMIFLILLALNILKLSKYIPIIDLVRYNILITGLLVVALILSTITFLISIILTILK